MKKLVGSITVKFVAVIVSYILLVALCVTLTATLIMGYYKFYFSNEETVKQEITDDMAENELLYLEQLIHDETNLVKYYADKNVYFDVVNHDTGYVYASNYDEKREYSVTKEREIVNEEWYPLGELDKVITNKGGYAVEEDHENDVALHATRYDVKLSVAKNLTKNDLFSVTNKIIELGFKLQYAVIFVMLFCLILYIGVVYFLFCSAGHTRDGEIKLNYLDKIPFDIHTAFIAVAAIVSVWAVFEMRSASLIEGLLISFPLLSVDYFLALGYVLSIATRVKTGTLFKNTLIFKIGRVILKLIKKFFGRLKFLFSSLGIVKKACIIMAFALIAEGIITLIAFETFDYFSELSVILMAAIYLFAAAFIIYIAVILRKIEIGGQKIIEGDFDCKIDTSYMFGSFKSFAEKLNSINDTLQTALNEEIKRERFKTELITNVSHDIKTPLTSIINYVDLIKKEDIKNAAANGYIEVLDRQSSRLKKLIEDLIEASKASSGILPVNLTKCDMAVLLSQVAGEFEDKFRKKGLTTVINLPESNTYIMADGRHLWRIFDNLMNNISKYAMPNTRVYLDVKCHEKKVSASFRNISETQLNITPDELMERFVRGDASRNTEGSGLGLSIARSLTELQNGEIKLFIDGDLFKVSVIFDLVE